jgi:hypothetical protein
MSGRIIRRRTDNSYWIIGPVALIDVSTRKWPYAVAMIDVADLTSVVDGGRRWYAARHSGDFTCYAKRSISGSSNKELMHRSLLECAVGNPDHISGDGLDNRSSNLRPATQSQNNANSVKRTAKTSKYKGVSFCQQTGMWRTTTVVGGKIIYGGQFLVEADAAKKYDDMLRQHHGEYARTNFPPVERSDTPMP